MKLIATEQARSASWYYTADGSSRGYIDPHVIRELWFHIGTTCNLACPFCLEGSRPGEHRLQLMKLDDVRPFIDEAVELGVEQFSFTGGEPFVAKGMTEILSYASRFRPCLVLTNGTEPVLRRIHQIATLANSVNPISFRVSIDYPDQLLHDSGRGKGEFDNAMEGIRQLHALGFKVSVARQMTVDEDAEVVTAQYRALFRQQQVSEDMVLIAFPDFMPPGSAPKIPQITEHCMTHYQTTESRRQFMCAFSKMVVKINGRMKVYACTLADDDLEYELGNTLIESLKQRISMKHHRCYSCFAYGSSCSEL